MRLPFLPTPWMAAGMDDGNYQNHVAVQFKNNEIWKPIRQSLASIPVFFWERFGVVLEALYHFANGVHELHA